MEDGAVPAPAVDDDHSSPFILRVAKGIRRWLAAQARTEGVSLNTPCGDDARSFKLGNGSVYAIASGIKTSSTDTAAILRKSRSVVITGSGGFCARAGRVDLEVVVADGRADALQEAHSESPGHTFGCLRRGRNVRPRGARPTPTGIGRPHKRRGSRRPAGRARDRRPSGAAGAAATRRSDGTS